MSPYREPVDSSETRCRGRVCTPQTRQRLIPAEWILPSRRRRGPTQNRTRRVCDESGDESRRVCDESGQIQTRRHEPRHRAAESPDDESDESPRISPTRDGYTYIPPYCWPGWGWVGISSVRDEAGRDSSDSSDPFSP